MSKVKVNKKNDEKILESMERKKEYMPKDRPKLVRTKKIIETVEEEHDVDENEEKEEEEEENEEEETKDIFPTKKQCSPQLLKSLEKARIVRKANADKRNELKNHEKDIMQKLLVKEVSEKYKSSREFKLMENKLKKNIINQLKEKKLQQLKQKYNYKSDEEESEEEEEEQIQKPIPRKKQNSESVFEVFNKYGF